MAPFDLKFSNIEKKNGKCADFLLFIIIKIEEIFKKKLDPETILAKIVAFWKDKIVSYNLHQFC